MTGLNLEAPRWWRKTGPYIDPTHTPGNLQAPKCNVVGSIHPSLVTRLHVFPGQRPSKLLLFQVMWRSM